MGDATESSDDVPPSTMEVDTPASISADNAGSDVAGAVAETAEALLSSRIMKIRHSPRR